MTFLLLKGLIRFDQPDYASCEKWRGVAVRVLYVGTQARSTVSHWCQKCWMSHYSEVIVLQDDFTVFYMKFIGSTKECCVFGNQCFVGRIPSATGAR